ncbi:unnamed protein product [Closterium sp. NIES-54]
MAAQELRWLTYLLTDLGEPPRSPPVLYVDNKAMLALCREQRLEHRTKHIALRYFLARELQQRGQLRHAYVASEANTADVFTKALAPWTNNPRPPTTSVPLTKLLGRRGLTVTRLLLALATTEGSTLRGCTSTSTTTAATSPTAAAASTTAATAYTTAAAAYTTSTATTEAPTPGTTPTSTATPSASSTASTAAPTVPSTTLAPLALAVAAPPTRSRRSPYLLSANEVDSSSRSNRGEGGQGNTPKRKGCGGRREKHLQLRDSSQLQ